MASTPPLWSGQQSEGHGWLAEPAPRPRPRLEEAPAPPPPPSFWKRARWWLAGAAAVLVLALAFGAGVLLNRDSAPPRADAPITVSGGRPGVTQVNKIYAAVARGVVNVQVTEGGGRSSGTGFVIDGDGTIVTNAHVVDTATTAMVRFDDKGNQVSAQVVGTDPSSDLAVLRVDATRTPRLHPLALADSDKVQVGDLAVAIGYPLGLDRTATSGIISGLGREIRAPNGFRIDKVLQTDAPINPGNSGGPLLDARGRVVGVNSQIASAGAGQGNIGIGFAIPSNTVRQVVPRLKKGQAIVRPWLGISTGPAVGRPGAAVRTVTSGGPAAAAGLRGTLDPTGQGGDVIVGVDGHPVASPDDVTAAIQGRSPGDVVQVDVERDGVRRSVPVKLGKRPTKVP